VILLRPIISISLVCVIVAFIANAGEPTTAAPKCAANQPIAAELQPLQGTWEGVMVGQEKDGAITITITGNSLHFYRDKNFWFETAITLPAGPNPRQLHATIKNSSPPTNSIGQVVRAIFKIEEKTLTLIPGGDNDEDMPKSFAAAEEKGLTRYELRRIQPPRKHTTTTK
jgi:uncharacterized protein (TIGR03067 family)